jgi:hypothetical protein
VTPTIRKWLLYLSRFCRDNSGTFAMLAAIRRAPHAMQLCIMLKKGVMEFATM